MTAQRYFISFGSPRPCRCCGVWTFRYSGSRKVIYFLGYVATLLRLMGIALDLLVDFLLFMSLENFVVDLFVILRTARYGFLTRIWGFQDLVDHYGLL